MKALSMRRRFRRPEAIGYYSDVRSACSILKKTCCHHGRILCKDSLANLHKVAEILTCCKVGHTPNKKRALPLLPAGFLFLFFGTRNLDNTCKYFYLHTRSFWLILSFVV